MSSIALDNAMMKPANGPKKAPTERSTEPRKKPSEEPPKEPIPGPSPKNKSLKDFKIPKVSDEVITHFSNQIRLSTCIMLLLNIINTCSLERQIR